MSHRKLSLLSKFLILIGVYLLGLFFTSTEIRSSVAAPIARSFSTISSTPSIAPPENVDTDLAAIGFTHAELQERSIIIRPHEGPIPKRCLSNGTITEGVATSEGLAVRHVRYQPCNNGLQPLFEEYKTPGFDCTVLYNQHSPKKLAILAHEIGHCFHHALEGTDEGHAFEHAYTELRGIEVHSAGFHEILADDYMICMHSLDTEWTGNANYYTRYNIPYPNSHECTEFNILADKYLI